MLINRNNEKLINSIIFFVINTKFCGKTKLFKLLYFLDFEHYSMTGRSVTGQNYFAWPKGPVPKDLFDELETQTDITSNSLSISKRYTPQGNEMLDITPQVDFSPTHFSKRELRLLEALSGEYYNSNANNMIEVTHLENLPWHAIYEVQGLKQNIIPYRLALKDSEYDQIIKNVNEHEEFKDNYK